MRWWYSCIMHVVFYIAAEKKQSNTVRSGERASSNICQFTSEVAELHSDSEGSLVLLKYQVF